MSIDIQITRLLTRVIQWSLLAFVYSIDFFPRSCLCIALLTCLRLQWLLQYEMASIAKFYPNPNDPGSFSLFLNVLMKPFMFNWHCSEVVRKNGQVTVHSVQEVIHNIVSEKWSTIPHCQKHPKVTTYHHVFSYSRIYTVSDYHNWHTSPACFSHLFYVCWTSFQRPVIAEALL